MYIYIYKYIFKKRADATEDVLFPCFIYVHMRSKARHIPLLIFRLFSGQCAMICKGYPDLTVTATASARTRFCPFKE